MKTFKMENVSNKSYSFVNQNNSKLSNFMTNFISASFLVLWSFLFFTGLWLMFQLSVFGAKILSLHIPLIGITIISFFALISRERIKTITPIAWGTLFLFSFFSATVSILFYRQGNFSTKEAVLTTIIPSMYYFLVAIVAGTRIQVSQKLAGRFIAALSLLAICFGLYQSIKGYSEFFYSYLKINGVQNYIFFGKTRPISIFSEIGPYGFFIAFISGIISSILIKNKSIISKLLYISLVIFLGYCEYTTLSRSGYLLFLMVLLFVFTFNFIRRFALLFPILSFVTGFSIYFLAPTLSDIGRSLLSHVASDQSVYTRYNEAIGFIHIILSNPYYTAFGPSFAASKLTMSGIYVDNQYLSVIISAGIFGLIIYAFAFAFLWRKIYGAAHNEPSPLRVAIAAFFGAWPCIGFFAVDNSYLVLAVLGLALAPIDHSTKFRGGTWSLM